MTLDLNMSYKYMKDIKDLSKVLISIHIAPILSVHRKMEPRRYGIVKKEDWNIPWNHILIQLSLVGKVIILLLVEGIR